MILALQLGLLFGLTPQAAPPIFQPGAPGTETRTIRPETAVALSRSTHVQADLDFMRHMIVHHGQAVEMVALADLHAVDPGVRLMAERIGASQAAEIDLMRDWLVGREPAAATGQAAGQSGTAMDHAAMGHAGAGHAGMDHSGVDHAAAPHGDHALMPGMLTPDQMRTLAESRGGDFDRRFLEGMIVHHEGALTMVEDLLADPDAAEDSDLSGFANHVTADQSAEILRMRTMLSQLDAQGATS